MTYIKASVVAQRLGVKTKTLTEWRSQGKERSKMAAAGSVDRAHRPPRPDLIGGQMATESLQPFAVDCCGVLYYLIGTGRRAPAGFTWVTV